MPLHFDPDPAMVTSLLTTSCNSFRKNTLKPNRCQIVHERLRDRFQRLVRFTFVVIVVHVGLTGKRAAGNDVPAL